MPSSTEPTTETRAVILVEGASDQRAVEVPAVRRGRDLAAEGVVVVAMGGITNLGSHLGRLLTAAAYDLDRVPVPLDAVLTDTAP
jgi:hypothetical protein